MPNQRPPIQPHLPLHEYTVGWISALPIEHAAAAELLDEEHESPPLKDSDPIIYTLGRIGVRYVVIACLPAGEIGTANAATVATRMVNRFPSVEIGLMVGIGGGVPSDDHDIRLGDVVVSQPGAGNGGVVQYDFGKAITGGEYQRTGHLNTPPPLLLNALAKAKSNHYRRQSDFFAYLETLENKTNFSRGRAGPDQLFTSTYSHLGGSTCGQCSAGQVVDREERPENELVQIHYGTIASGNTVMEDVVQRNLICQELGNSVLCFEMEAAGLMNNFPCLVIRGICDYADSHKNKNWQPYAAATAAAYAKEILSVIPPKDVMNPTPTKAHPIPAPWHVPFARNSHFTGRRAMLERLHCCFNDTSTHPYVAIHGLGGCGKSAVAIEFVHQARKRHSCAVFWVSAFDALRFEQSYRAVARVLQIPEANDPEKSILELVKQKLDQYHIGKWLMVVDNADEEDFLWNKGQAQSDKRLWDYLPQNSNGMILFTTRHRKIAIGLARNDHHLLDKMDSGEAEELLRKSLEHQPTLDSNDAVGELLELLSFLPLAIIQALAYMKANGTSVKRYLELLQKTDDSMFTLLKKDFPDTTRDGKSHNAVVATWLTSFQHIKQNNPLAAEYLSFSACIAPQNVPRSIFPPISSDDEQEEAISTLTGYAFFSERTEGNCYDVHALVHLVTRNWLKEIRVRNWLKKIRLWTKVARTVVKRLRQIIPMGGHEQIKQYPVYLPHGLFTAGIAEIVDEEATIELLERIGSCRYSLGEYSHAISTHQEVLDRKMRVFGPKEVTTLLTMNDMGLALCVGGHYIEAEKMHREALQLKKTVLGKTHHRTLSSMNNLAAVLFSQEKYAEAEKMYRETLQLKKKVLGKTHPTILTNMNNLAALLSTQGKYAEAEEMLLEALQLRETVIGTAHPDTLVSRYSLAWTLKRQGRTSEAIDLMSQCVEKSIDKLGIAHPITKKRSDILKRWQGEFNDSTV